DGSVFHRTISVTTTSRSPENPSVPTILYTPGTVVPIILITHCHNAKSPK
ncbi:Hypothetical protein CINCED_3A005861, partial [Cinara cedri]